MQTTQNPTRMHSERTNNTLLARGRIRSSHHAALLNKLLSHVANTNKNNGLIKFVRVKKKPEILGESVYK